MLLTLAGPTRFPLAGRLETELETISIHPSHVVAGMVKFPLYCEPAGRTIVSPHDAALIARCNDVPFPPGTKRIQLVPVVNEGQAEAPC
jgi:hypothetical protein